jgi:DNA-binding transcriptional MerR regulator/effector-binding domain-containing protein
MFAIGDFARLGRVSVRMLRHYDALGLLVPARVDPSTGYRSYAAAQLSRLNRIIALKDLGFTLRQVGEVLDEKVGIDELQGMLRLRRAELETEAEAARARLLSVEARLAIIEAEGRMPAAEVVVKRIPAIRVAETTGIAASYESADVGPVIGPLFDQLCSRLEAAGIETVGAGIACYEPAADGVLIHAALPVAVDLGPGSGFEVVDLPPIEAATLVHHGSMDTADFAVQQLGRWIEANGYHSLGYARELNLECPPDRNLWVTELQEPIVKTARPGTA